MEVLPQIQCTPNFGVDRDIGMSKLNELDSFPEGRER